MNVLRFLCLFCILSVSLSVTAQQKILDLPLMIKQRQISTKNRIISNVDDSLQGINLSKSLTEGTAWLNDVTFSNGTIELDIRGRDILQGSFVGVAFHGTDNDTAEVVYFRPFNFRSFDSARRAHAVQYAYHPAFGWEKLRNEKPGMYENSIVPAPAPGKWFHARIVVQYPEIKVFVNRSETPSLIIKEISEHKEGKLGLWVGSNSEGEFANLTITK